MSERQDRRRWGGFSNKWCGSECSYRKEVCLRLVGRFLVNPQYFFLLVILVLLFTAPEPVVFCYEGQILGNIEVWSSLTGPGCCGMDD
jgi:hypothetical protein